MRKLWRIAAVWIAAALLCGLLGGCGFKDIDKRFFVIGMGIDRGHAKTYEISLMLAIPTPKLEPGASLSQIVSAEGDSIAEAVRRMKSMVDKEFDFGHMKIIVIGQDYAERDMKKPLDWLSRRRDVQQIAFMAVGEPDAKSVLKVKPPSERLPGNGLILSFTREGTESPYIVPEFLFDYCRRMRGYGQDPFLPVIAAKGGTYDISRVVIAADGRRKLELSPADTEVFNQLVRRYPRFVLKGEHNGRPFEVAVEQLRIHYRIVTAPGRQPSIEMRVSAQGEVEESEIPLFGENWDGLERRLAGELERRYAEVLEKLRKAKTDPVGFGLRYRATRHDPAGEWQEWQRLYPEIKFNIRAKIAIKGTGIVK